MSHYTALLDANVLYPAPMRDVLMQLAVTDIFKAKWSEDIHREWIDALMRNEPDRDRAALERTRDLMNQATRDSLPVTTLSSRRSISPTQMIGMCWRRPLSADAM